MLTRFVLSAAIILAPAAQVFAQDAMAGDAMAGDAMAGDSMAMDAMAPMGDDDLALCIEQAQAITFAEVAAVAEEACHGVHNGDPMAGDAMGSDAMAGDAMAGDAMAGDAMAQQQ